MQTHNATTLEARTTQLQYSINEINLHLNSVSFLTDTRTLIYINTRATLALSFQSDER